MPDFRVAPEKIQHYLLDPTSETGGPKARFFIGYGFSPARWSELAAALADHPGSARLESIDPTSRYGEKYVFRCEVTTPNGRDPCIRTIWQLRDGDFRPATAYPGP